MKRTFNYTGRTKIPRRMITITLRHLDDGGRTFDFGLALEELELPDAAPVRLEAYHRQSLVRFDCGTVGSLTPPLRPDLSEITSDRVNFRIKILDPASNSGRILAAADRIRPTIEDVSEHESILPVEPWDLGDEIWRIEFEEDAAVLQINNAIPDPKLWVRSSPVFSALVFPAVLRRILTQILLVEDYLEPEEDHWTGQWITYARTLLSEPVPPADARGERVDWIEVVVENFAKKFRLRSLLIENLESIDT